MTPSRPDVWWAALSAAHQASWRLVIAVSAVVALPGSVICIIGVAVSGAGVLVPMILALVLVSLSPFVHELGHVTVQVVLADAARQVVAGRGTWSSGAVLRWGLDVHGDGAVAIAGPLAALGCGVVVLALPVPFVLSGPVAALSWVHLRSLRRTAPDGVQVRRAIRARY